MVKESLSRVDLEYDCEVLWLEIFSHTRPTYFAWTLLLSTQL